MNKDCTHGNVTHGGDSVHVWGGISHMGKTSLCVLEQMSLEPFIAEFWRNTWFHMAGHGMARVRSVNLRQLGVVVQNLWQQIPLERVHTLVSSMPRIVR